MKTLQAIEQNPREATLIFFILAPTLLFLFRIGFLWCTFVIVVVCEHVINY